MGTEAPAGHPVRPRPWLLIALAVVVGLFLVWWVLQGKSAAPAAPPSNPRTQAAKTTGGPIDPAELDVRLEALKAPAPAASGGDRNPFRFYVRPPPPPPPVDRVPARPGNPGPPAPVVPDGPPQPVPPPPITLKYIGVMETGMGKIAAFTDCRVTLRGREGDIIDGRYRLVRIGVESVVLEYVDGRGRSTIRMSGDCPGR